MNAHPVQLFATCAEYAKHRGVSDSLVRRWKRAGRLVLSDDGKRIAIHASDVVLGQSLDPRGGDRTGKPKPPVDPVFGAGRDSAPIDFASANARDKQASAELKELDLATRAGNLVPRAEVEALVRGLAVSAREALLALPSRVAADLLTVGQHPGSSVDAATAMEALLTRELRAVCDRLANDAGAALCAAPAASEASA
jgi:hypothetical protein